jgi:hypothetical protein
MSIAWPAQLPDGTRLQLVIEAKPVGDNPAFAEFEVIRHEFRTASRGASGLRLRPGVREWKDNMRKAALQRSFALGS